MWISTSMTGFRCAIRSRGGFTCTLLCVIIMIRIISVASESQSSPRVVCAQLLFGGEELDAVLQLEEALLLRLVLHALVLLEVLGRNTLI